MQRAYPDLMVALEDCIARLRPLIEDADADGLPAAREIMSEFVACHVERGSRGASLLALEGQLAREADLCEGSSRSFVFGLIEWADTERRRSA